MFLVKDLGLRLGFATLRVESRTWRLAVNGGNRASGSGNINGGRQLDM